MIQKGKQANHTHKHTPERVLESVRNARMLSSMSVVPSSVGFFMLGQLDKTRSKYTVVPLRERAEDKFSPKSYSPEQEKPRAG